MKKKLTSLLISVALIVSLFAGLAFSARADSSKLIAITFDDGPGNYTSTLLDGLKKRNVPATFFMCGVNGSYGVKNFNHLLTRMVSEGHQLADHSWGHPTFSKLSGSAMQSQVSQVGAYLTRAMGGDYNYLVRIPGGENNATIRANVNHPIITWSVDPLDWKYRNADTVYNNIIKGASDGAIILLHDIYSSSVEGGLRAIDTLKSQGYTFVTVSELFRRRGITLQNGTVYSSAPRGGTTLPAYSAPSIQVSGGTVRVTTPSSGLTLHYTTDGSDPTLASPVTDGSISLNSKVTLKVAGFDSFGTRTPVAAQTVDANIAEPPAITAVSEGSVTLTSGTAGAVIRYTTDGSEPSGSSAVAPGGTFTPGTVNKAIATASGKNPSAVTTFYATEYGDLFYDVPSTAWYYSFVGSAVHQKLMVGTTDYIFSPAAEMTRAMLVTVLYSMEGKPAVGNTSPFSDVKTTAWYAAPIIWAAQNHLVEGFGDGIFGPNRLITRQQTAAILFKYAVYKGAAEETQAAENLDSFTDHDRIAVYAQPAMAWAVRSGILSGFSDNTLRPADTCPRAQCATMMVRYQETIQALTVVPEDPPEPAASEEPVISPEAEPEEESSSPEMAEEDASDAPSEVPPSEEDSGAGA